MSGLNTHTCTLAWHTPIGGGERSAGWMCSCGEHGFTATMSLAAQRFAEHYALAKQQAAPKVRRGAPEHDGGRTLDADTIRKSEQAVVLALYFGRDVDGAADGEPLTDLGIAAASRRSIIVASVGEFSPSRLRTARVELERAGFVEKRALVSRGAGRRMQSFALTDAGVNMAHRLVAGPSAAPGTIPPPRQGAPA